jgi:GNAT superfamily N-acetyltransferase
MSSFNLPVLGTAGKVATADELLRRSLHAEAIADAARGEIEHLNVGTAIWSPDLPDVTGANQVRDAQAPDDGGDVAAAVDEAMAFFEGRGVRPRVWSFAGGTVADDVVSVLESRGYRRAVDEVWGMRTPRLEGPPTGLNDLTVIPIRASFGKLRELMRVSGPPGQPPVVAEQHAEAAVRALDDSRVDGVLALAGDVAVGAAYLVTAGEAGLMTDLTVRPDHRRRGLGTLLIARIAELAARSRHRSLTLFCAATDTPARNLYQKTGWEKVADCVRMRLTETP